MSPLDHASKILDTLLGYLGFAVKIDQDEGPEGPTLMIHSQDDSERLVGKRGATLEDIQYLVNRVLQRHVPGAPRIRVDVDHYRAMREDQMLEQVREVGERVRLSGKPEWLPPMNSYYRRLVHQIFVNDADLQSSSQQGQARYKRMRIARRQKPQA